MPASRVVAWLVGAALVAVIAAGCAPRGTDDDPPEALVDRSDLVPTFPVVSTSTVPPTVAPPQPTDPLPPASVSVAQDRSAPNPTMAGIPLVPTARITDPAGDATAGASDAPPWAELLGATLVRPGEFFELRIQLGAPAPSSSGAPDHTMNIAAFADTDGDGLIDYELWANLADGGWDVAWFDDDAGTGAYSDDAAMDVLVDGADLVVRFPAEYVGLADAFRWSLASEYGMYAALGTPMTARDEAPDGGAAAMFPG